VDAATATMGPVGGIVMGIVTICASFTTGNAYIAALPRMLYGMARGGLVPQIFGKLHPRRKVPTAGIIFTTGLILIIMIYVTANGGSSDVILKLINVACIIWAAVAAYAVIWNKTHGIPINERTHLKVLVKGVKDRSEPLPVWDEAVEEWLAGQD
jgi:amino acid transporter